MSKTPVPIRSSFLGRLVDEAFGVESALQPRKKSLFEPARAKQLAADQSVGVLAQQGGEQPIERVAPIRRDSLREASQDPEPAMRRDDSQTPHRFEARTQAHVDADVPAPAERIEFQAQAPALVPAMPAPNIATRVPLARVSDTKAPLSVQNRVADASTVERDLEPSLRRAPAEAQKQPRRSDTARDSGFDRAAHDHEFRIQTEISGVLLPKPVEQDVVPPISVGRDRDAAAPLPAEPAFSQSPAVVNVTIGRVEVRATQQQTRTVEQRGQRPMSLDDYLKGPRGQ